MAIRGVAVPALSARTCGRVHVARHCSARRLVLTRAQSGGAQIMRSKSAVMKKSKAWIQQELASRDLSPEGLKPELAERLLMAVTSEEMEASPVELKPTMSALKKLRKAQLMCVLKQRSLDATGNKDVLVQRLLASLNEKAAPVEEDLVAEARKLTKKLTNLDVAVTAFKQKMDLTEDSRLEVQQEAATLRQELQALRQTAESDQREAIDADEVLEGVKKSSELLPVIAERKEMLMSLKENITAKETQALELRAKLRLVEQAKLVGVENIPEEVVVQEEPLLVTAFVEEGSNTAVVTKTRVPSSVTTSNPTITSFYTGSQERQTVSSAYLSGSGPGRVQMASARSNVYKPAFDTLGPSGSPSSPANRPRGVVPAVVGSPVTSPASELARRPEAVGIAITYGLMTIAKGLKALIN